MKERLTADNCLPADGCAGALLARVWMPGEPAGPVPAAVRDSGVHDLSTLVPTVSGFLEDADAARLVREADAPLIGPVADLLANSDAETRDPSRPHFLAPCDLQALKAAGVTFADSMLERVIEERAKGDPSRADKIRGSLRDIIGVELSEIVPGSEDAQRLKDELIERGYWSQYLEVAIGPDAEVFTKSQPMSAVGIGAAVGLHPGSTWNNPEPEVALAVNSAGTIVGATLANDVNLRDFEGRSALLLGKAKDNNGSCGLGPFLRLFDGTLSLDDVRSSEISMSVEGPDGFRLDGASSMSKISRDPADIVAQTIGPAHQYPDGLLLMLGTMFAPTQDRKTPGEGFTHETGDIVSVRTPSLGCLVQRVDLSDRIEPWTFGTRALMENLASRGLL